MYCHSPLMRGISLVAKLVVALFAIHYLLVFLGYNYFGGVFAGVPGSTTDKIVHWLVGLAGLYLLVKVVIHLFGVCHECVDHTHSH